MLYLFPASLLWYVAFPYSSQEEGSFSAPAPVPVPDQGLDLASSCLSIHNVQLGAWLWVLLLSHYDIGATQSRL